MKKKKRCKKIKIIFLLLVALMTLFIILEYLSKRVMMYAVQESITKSSMMITSVINDEVLTLFDISKVYDRDKGYINTQTVNHIMKESNNVLNSERKINIDSVYLPIGLFISEILFSGSNIGVNIKTRPVSAFTTDIVSSIDEYGINNSVLRVDLRVKVNMRIMIPFNEQTFEVVTNVPIVMVILEGNIPNGIIYSK